MAPIKKSEGRWVATWTSMPQETEPGNLPPMSFFRHGLIFENATIRQTVRISIGGSAFRLRVSNVFGESKLQIGNIGVALPRNDAGGLLAGSSKIDCESYRCLTFAGLESITIPKGASAISDVFILRLDPGSVVSISTYLPAGQVGDTVTSHPGSRTLSWMADGNQTQNGQLPNNSSIGVHHWYYISGVDVCREHDQSCTIALVGDSITDGRESTNNCNNRWPDLLFDRMQNQASVNHIGIANQSAGGNRVLEDGLGPNVMSRFERDVLAQSGIAYVLIFSGVNDIGTTSPTQAAQSTLYQELTQAYAQLIAKCHSHDLACFGATLGPFGSNPDELQPYSNGIRESTRQRINHWIRSSTIFDAVIDFDMVLRDPQDPRLLKRAFDCGDHLHPNLAGFRAMAGAFPLEILESPKHDICETGCSTSRRHMS